MSLRTPLARVRHLGSAKDGTAHWWAQRVTAIALIPLTVWFVISVVSMVGADYHDMVAWVSSPLVAALLIALILSTFYHSALGLQVVIEDYVHGEGLKVTLLLLNKGINFLLALIGTVSVLMLLL